MKKDFYNILGISENIVNYTLTKGERGFEVKISSNERRDKLIKEAYKEKYEIIMCRYQEELKKLKENYEIQKKLLQDKYEKSIGAKKLGLKSMNNSKENTVEKLRIKMENEIQEYENEMIQLNKKYEQCKTDIMKKYDTLLQNLMNAYNEIKSSELREINSTESSRKNRQNKQNRQISFETAFDFFGIPEERLQSFNPIRADEIIREEYVKRMKNYEGALSDSSISFSKRKKIEALQMLCQYNYDLISNPEKRVEYFEFLDNEELKEKYSKVSQFNPDLIFSSDSHKFSIYSQKSKDTKELFLKNNMTIKKVATLLFKNSTGVMNSYINQYEVKRNVGDGEKIDYIYSDIDFQQLDKDQDTGLPVNAEYYDCVVSELLSEEMIKGSKFNHGYIGLVESINNDNGERKYRTTLQDKELHQTEQEYFAAVMIHEMMQNSNENLKDEYKIVKSKFNQSTEEDGR